MIKADTPDRPGFAMRIAQRTRRSAEAYAVNHLLSRRQDYRRWRIARLLWPNFREEI